MSRIASNDVNRLIGEFTDLQEIWAADPERFDWTRLVALAQDGAQAYNDGAGPSFHALALDGVEHSAFHERFLDFLLQAGFDPFHLSHPATGVAPIPVIDHAGLCDAADISPSSARMRAVLMELARERFLPVANDAAASGPVPPEIKQVVTACAESIPLDLLERIAPELASPRGTGTRRRSANPVEGYLSTAEIIGEGGRAPYG